VRSRSSGGLQVKTSGLVSAKNALKMSLCIWRCPSSAVDHDSRSLILRSGWMFAHSSQLTLVRATSLTNYSSRRGDREAVDQTARESDIGKLTPTSLYVHISALNNLAPLLRVYEGCARVLIGAVVEGANVVKIHRDNRPFLTYPTQNSKRTHTRLY